MVTTCLTLTAHATPQSTLYECTFLLSCVHVHACEGQESWWNITKKCVCHGITYNYVKISRSTQDPSSPVMYGWGGHATGVQLPIPHCRWWKEQTYHPISVTDSPLFYRNVTTSTNTLTSRLHLTDWKYVLTEAHKSYSNIHLHFPHLSDSGIHIVYTHILGMIPQHCTAGSLSLPTFIVKAILMCIYTSVERNVVRVVWWKVLISGLCHCVEQTSERDFQFQR